MQTRYLFLAALGSVFVIGATVPASADWDGRDRREWHEHRGWRPGYYPPPVYYAPAPRVYYAPPRAYYAPPPVYYAPPPVYYERPPSYYVQPGISFGINIR